jgi:glycine/D-amino acid oxidase-like deaminating enzyme
VPPETLVIGGGIQGATAALALAERGVSSTIVEAEPALLSRASVRNEGKIHLGFVYALDHSGETVRQMVTGALTFAPLLQRWCGEIDWSAMRSDPFAYVVMRDSLASVADLERHYRQVVDTIESLADDLGTDYCGVDLGSIQPVEQGSGAPPGMSPSADLDWFQTPEISLDPRALCDLIASAVASNPLIEVATEHRVVGVARESDQIVLTCETPDGARDLSAGHVLDCAWQGRAALDEMAGLEPERLIYRLKHQVIVRAESQTDAPSDLRPITMVQGAYGDLVPWRGGEVYISWYPASRTFIGSAPEASDEPDAAVAEATLGHLRGLVPALDRYEVVDHGPGWILAPDPAHEASDISAYDSPLHDRSRMDAVTEDGWWSLRSYKLTTAPLAADRCAERVAEALGVGAREPA